MLAEPNHNRTEMSGIRAPKTCAFAVAYPAVALQFTCDRLGSRGGDRPSRMAVLV
jgi:hypothetical protein